MTNQALEFSRDTNFFFGKSPHECDKENAYLTQGDAGNLFAQKASFYPLTNTKHD